MQDINKRFDRIEERLLNIELKLGIAPEPTTKPEAPKPAAATTSRNTTVTQQKIDAEPSRPQSTARNDSTTASTRATPEPVSATRLMAWCGALTLVLAAVYFLKLVYDTGWLTPERQVGLATLAGFALIAAGLYFQQVDRAYSAFLPAVGLVVLYLACFAAHPYYDLISRNFAIVCVGVISVLGIWLGRKLENSVYVVLAAVGVYLTPLLMGGTHPALLDLVIYYSAWSLLFSFCAIQEGRHIGYVLPMFLALLSFDLAWRESGRTDWVLAASYQLIQFLIFSVTAGLFAVVHQQPLSRFNAFLHGLALLVFYGIEYAILNHYIPAWAPVLAICSAVFVVLVFVAARRALKDNAGAGAAIVSGYCSFVTVHAVFLELIPLAWLPWAVLVLPALLFSVRLLPLFKSQSDDNSVILPPIVATALLLIYGFISLVVHSTTGTKAIPLPNVALLGYAAMLYGGYWLFSRNYRLQSFSIPLLYAGHLALMTATLRIIDSNLMLSVTWAVVAIVLLLGAIKVKDKIIGQSALLIFFASGLKVLLYDLSDSNSMIRVLTLVVLSVSLYAGGWLYQSLVRGILKLHPNPVVNRQLNYIYELVAADMSDADILQVLVDDNIPHLGGGEWTLEGVTEISGRFRKL